MTRDLGRGFKAAYERLSDGCFEVKFFRNGRKIVGTVFRPHREEDALRVFTGTTREDLMRTLKVQP